MVFRGGPGINNVIIGTVPALCENAPLTSLCMGTYIFSREIPMCGSMGEHLHKYVRRGPLTKSMGKALCCAVLCCAVPHRIFQCHVGDASGKEGGLYSVRGQWVCCPSGPCWEGGGGGGKDQEVPDLFAQKWCPAQGLPPWVIGGSPPSEGGGGACRSAVCFCILGLVIEGLRFNGACPTLPP